MLGKKYGPAVVLPIMMFCFGAMTLLTASAQNFGIRPCDHHPNWAITDVDT